MPFPESTSPAVDFKNVKKIHFLGICGTGMASVAGLCQEAGFKVEGSDQNMFPPMSTMLNGLGIPVKTPYSPANILQSDADLFIVANALSKSHMEVEALLQKGKPYLSFPALLGQLILSQKKPIVVAGTHGKTTTTSLITHLLRELNLNPGYLIGGLPRGFTQSFSLGKGEFFVIEGDEYDTAFFDKGPKFLHYRPFILVMNNIEFDHADIYPTVEAIEERFYQLACLVPQNGAIVFNADDERIARIVERPGIRAALKVGVATRGKNQQATVVLKKFTQDESSPGQHCMKSEFANGTILTTSLVGSHNAANISQSFGVLTALQKLAFIEQLQAPALEKAYGNFAGVKRRLDFLGSKNGIDAYEDFAHHPTAVEEVIRNYRALQPGKRLIVAFEPKNATSRRNTFHKEYVSVFSLADRVMIGPAAEDKKIPLEERMDTAKLAGDVGPKASSFTDNDLLLEQLKKEVKSGDTVIFMSPGSFSGIQHRFAEDLKKM